MSSLMPTPSKEGKENHRLRQPPASPFPQSFTTQFLHSFLSLWRPDTRDCDLLMSLFSPSASVSPSSAPPAQRWPAPGPRHSPARYVILGRGSCPPPLAVSGRARNSWERRRPRRLQGSWPGARRAMLGGRLSPDGSGETGTRHSLGEPSSPHPPQGPMGEPQAAEVGVGVGVPGRGQFPLQSALRVSLPSPPGASQLPRAPLWVGDLPSGLSF